MARHHNTMHFRLDFLAELNGTVYPISQCLFTHKGNAEALLAAMEQYHEGYILYQKTDNKWHILHQKEI